MSSWSNGPKSVQNYHRKVVESEAARISRLIAQFFRLKELGECGEERSLSFASAAGGVFCSKGSGKQWRLLWMDAREEYSSTLWRWRVSVMDRKIMAVHSSG
ncbi:5780_t:CDS:2 [Ambispora gerdemannii]|uniref:5780_t:CDS:1 n=1 Tax=Ambispora gerdemannii TaxID=144530 RepID=A0A9N9FJW9_9GLOM|nr:5780_t:CDS:2 [Ambispora gerdemannii]